MNVVVEKVVDYIEAHLDDELTLDKIADALNYSKFYVVRAFNEETGSTVYKYIQGRRLTLAAQTLVKTDQPIIEIAYRAHYDSQQAFTLAFKQVYECTPKIYRSLFTFVCLVFQQYNYTFHELRMQLENQVVQIQIQTNEAFQIIWEAFLYS